VSRYGIRAGIRRFFRLGVRRAHLAAADAEREIDFHLEARMEQLLRQGMSREEARVEAMRRFGDVEGTRADLSASAVRLEAQLALRDRLDGVRDDLRYASRALARNRGFTIVVVLTFALGIGANAAMFGIIDRLLLSGPAHVVDPDRVQRLYVSTVHPAEGPQTFPHFGYVTYAMLRDQGRTGQRVAAYTNAYLQLVGEGTSADRVPVASATWDFFPLLGVRPAVGRFFLREEDSPPEGQRVVVLSHELWTRAFGADSAIIGKTVRVSAEPHTVVGVAPPGFTGVSLAPVDAWVPMTLYQPVSNFTTSWRGQWLQVVARLAPGATPDGASAEATALYRRNYAGRAAEHRSATLSLRPTAANTVGAEAQEITVARWLVGVSVVVLLIACANVANLMLARGAGRRREIALRLAVGITTRRLLRLLLLEGLLLAFAGCMLGLVLAYWGGSVIRALLLPDVAWIGAPVNPEVLAVATVISVACGLLVALVPSLQATRVGVTSALKAGSPQAGAPRSRLRGALLFAQCALSVVLLVGAGLFLRSFQRVRQLDLGFQPEHVLMVRLSWPPADHTPRRQRSGYESALAAVRARPDVRHAGIAVGTPFGFSFGVDLWVPGRDSIPALPGGGPYASVITDGYFEAMGTRLVNGRMFTGEDRANSERVTIVNEPMARTLWPGQDPLGKCLQIFNQTLPCARVVGVVAEMRRNQLREPSAMQFYVPYGQEVGIGGSSIMLRATGTPQEVAPRIQRDLRELDPSLMYVQAQPLLKSIDPLRRQWRLGAALFGIFGVLALAIAAVGLYSVIAYLVAQRTTEFGVRMALGATGGRIVGLVVRGGMTVAVAGLAAGVGAALVAARHAEPLLFDTSPRDPIVIAAVVAVLLAVALLACLVPAARATRVDAVMALRAE
jgi:predicted permease